MYSIGLCFTFLSLSLIAVHHHTGINHNGIEVLAGAPINSDYFSQTFSSPKIYYGFQPVKTPYGNISINDLGAFGSSHTFDFKRNSGQHFKFNAHNQLNYKPKRQSNLQTENYGVRRTFS
jgi:hypothetical protein